MRRNNHLDGYVGGTAPAAFSEVFRVSVMEQGTGIPYLYAYYNESGQLTNAVILAALGIFGVFIIYSLFQVSVRKRMSQYSVMQTLGMEEKHIFWNIVRRTSSDICCRISLRLPAWQWYCSSVVWENRTDFRRCAGKRNPAYRSTTTDLSQISVSSIGDIGRFYVDKKLLLCCLLFFVAVLVFLSLFLVRKMRRYTLGGR